MYYVYLLSNTLTGAFYVGKSSNPKRRFGQHYAKAWEYDTKMSAALRESNPSDWVITILHETASHAESFKLETAEIHRRDAYAVGLNTRPSGLPDAAWNAGNRGLLSEETRTRMSEAKQGNTHAADYHRDPEKQAAWLEKVKSFGKKVVCVTTGEVFASVGEAAEFIGSNRCDVRRVCNGKRSHIKDHVFKWYDV